MADISKISPDNGTTIYNLKDIEARKRVPEVLLKDTVGWTGKNLAKSYFITVNTAKDSNALFIEGDLKPSTEYILSFETPNVYNFYVNTNLTESPASINTIAGKNELSFTTKDTISKDNNTQYNTTYGWRILLNGIAQSTNVSLTNIMLRDASITDNTYEPYHASVEEVVGDIRAEQAVLGAKNLFRFNDIASGALYATINSDGSSIKVKSETANAYAHTAFRVPVQPNTDYIFTAHAIYTSGMAYASIATNTDVKIVETDRVASDLDVIMAFNSGNNSIVRIKLFSTMATSEVGEVDYNNAMLRLASDPDDTYVPYAMTNREITEELTVQEADITTTFTKDTTRPNLVRKVGNVITLDVNLTGVTATSGTEIGNIPEGFRLSSKDSNIVIPILVSGALGISEIRNNGKIMASSNISNGSVRIHASWITS